MARLILDTSALVAVERRRLSLDPLADDDLAIAAITAAELLLGVELADAKHHDARAVFVEQTLSVIPIEDYTERVARTHAQLLAHARRQGRPRGPHDLILAATAAATKRTILTGDARARVGDLPGVHVRAV